jgi:hypothetical protein
MSNIPADLRYSPDHLWVRPGTGGGLVRVGVTDFAQRSLGDVVQVTLPDLGETIKAGEAWQPGTDPERRDYASFADFADPDGNTWVLQEIGYRRS